jgi:hypothetical protein
MKRTLLFLTALLVILFPISVLADLIDFEDYSAGAYLGPVSTATNEVTFWSRIHTNGDGMFAAKTVATQPGDPPILGSVYLVDQNPQSNQEDYFIQFENPVTNISLDFFDYDDGGLTDWAILTAFSNSDYTGSVSSVSVHPQGDKSIINMLIPDTSSPVLSLSLEFDPLNNDHSTGIDNLSFTTVPIPSTILLLGSGLAGLAAARRRRSLR